MIDTYPFTVRVQDGRQLYLYVEDAQMAAFTAHIRTGQPVTLVVRADEPFVRYPSRLRRLLDWWES